MQDSKNSSSSTFLQSARSVLWPIYGKENKLFLPMTFMLALILFAYTVCRGIKDTGVMKATGVEDATNPIPFLKLWAVLPFALLFFILFSWLSNRFNRRSLFYIVIIPFLVYFAAYAFLIYPNADNLHPIGMADSFVDMFEDGPIRNWVNSFTFMFKYWTHTSYYVMSELWGSAVLSLLFWQFANDIIPIPSAKRFYAHFYIVANVGVMAAGYLTTAVNKAYDDNYTVALQIMVSIVVLAGALAVVLYYYVNNSVLTDPDFQLTEGAKPAKKEKAKMSIGEGFKFLLSSPYLGLIALLVICYGISINLVEVLWKEMIGKVYTTKTAMNAYMGDYFFWTGLFTIVAILVGSSVLRRFGWRVTALATPILLGGSAVIFYSCVLWKNELGVTFGIAETSILSAAVFIGLIQNLLSKPTKYAMFDPTKEMAYIPLDPESKMKGKAAVDVVGARLGKSGGAAIGQVLAAVFGGSAIAYAPASFAITVGIVLIWIAAAAALSKRFRALTGEK
jgi:AAA family ATP:ADP antiporter